MACLGRARDRSELKTLWSSSIFSSMNDVSLASPTKRTSHPGTPLKPNPQQVHLITTNTFLFHQIEISCVFPVKYIAAGGIPNPFQRQASGGVTRKGGVKNRLNLLNTLVSRMSSSATPILWHALGIFDTRSSGARKGDAPSNLVQFWLGRLWRNQSILSGDNQLEGVNWFSAQDL